MARNSADVIDGAIQDMLPANDDSLEAQDINETSEPRLIERAPGLPLSAAEDPQWDDDREATYATDFDRLAPWQEPDLSDSPEWEEAKTSYFERTANFELLDSKFVQEYTDRLPGGLRDLVASETEPARPVRKNAVRETESGLSAAALFGDLDHSHRFGREHSEHFAYQVSPELRQSSPASPLMAAAKPAASAAPRAADTHTGPRRRTGSETIRERRIASPSFAPAAAPSAPALDPNAFDFDEVSVATARGGRRFAPERHPASQPLVATFSASVRPTLRSPLARNAPSQAPAPAAIEPVSQVPTRKERPSRVSHPAALPVSAGFDSEIAELRGLRRNQTAAWVWFAGSALAGVLLVLVVRAWTTGSLTFHEPATQPSVAVETTVSASAQTQPAETGFSITSLPEGAHIYVDGRSTGFVTPAQIRAVTPGLHSIELKLTGYYDTSLPAAVTENSVLELASVTMRPHLVEAEPFASVAPTGGIVAKLTAAERRAARREAREARRAARHRAISRNAPVRGLDEADDRSAGPVGDGTLRINSRPWARVLIDNKFVGNTPQRALRVAAGEHSVRLINEPLNMSKSFRVTIHEGETVTRVEMLNDDADQSQATTSRGREAYATR